MKRVIIVCSMLLALAAHAELQLNGLFTDNMVLQRNQPVPVWGTADPGAQVTVEFNGQKKVGVASGSGKWQVLLDPMNASSVRRPFQVSSFAFQVSRSNVLIGDVWLCTGQSNMATVMKRYLIWDQVKDGFENDQLRLFKIKEGGVGSSEPTKELVIDRAFNNSWQSCTPEFAAEFSATAGFFGMKLQHDTGVPVGLLYAVRGGTQANMWMAREVLESRPEYARFLDPSNENWNVSKGNSVAIRAPSHLYNGTIHPLAPFAIRGAIWYQGESDSQWSELYESLMGDLIASWREEWGYEFPFLYVQLAPYDLVNWDRLGEGWAWLREAQLQTLKSVPNTGMAVITDGGEAKDIHPQAKNLPGERLAEIAANFPMSGKKKGWRLSLLPMFGKKEGCRLSLLPMFGKMKVKGGKARLSFDGVFQGLETRRVALNTTKGHLPGQGPNAVVAEANELKGFTICGADRKFVPAEAAIIFKDTVEVWSLDVKQPVAVRYGWANFPLCNLYGGNGMPASPFRTDDFPMPNLTGEKQGEPFSVVKPEWGRAMELLNNGDGVFQTLKIQGVNAQKADGAYLYAFAPDWNAPASASIRVVYFDEGFATIQMRYDSTDSEIFDGNVPGCWKPAGEVNCKNSKQWKVAVFDLPDAKFTKRCNGGDLRVQSNGLLTIGGLYIQEKK